MSSADFEKVLVKDDRLGNVTDKLKFGVYKGAQNITPSAFLAVSQTPSSHVYNVQVPSEQTLIDRLVLWRSSVTLQLAVNAPIGASQYFTYGLDTSLAPFPLHQLMTTIQSTINNNTSNINIRDVLPMILRQHDRRELMRYNGYTPVAFDTVSNYADVIGTNSNPLGAWSNNADNDLVPRGSWVLDSISLNPDGTGVIPAPDGNQRNIYLKFTVTEPLLISPFIFCHPKSNNQAFYGIQNLNFQMNVGDASRCLRFARGAGAGIGGSNIVAVSVYEFQNSQLVFNFLTPHPSDLLPARNVVPQM